MGVDILISSIYLYALYYYLISKLGPILSRDDLFILVTLCILLGYYPAVYTSPIAECCEGFCCCFRRPNRTEIIDAHTDEVLNGRAIEYFINNGGKNKTDPPKKLENKLIYNPTPPSLTEYTLGVRTGDNITASTKTTILYNSTIHNADSPASQSFKSFKSFNPEHLSVVSGEKESVSCSIQ